VGSLVRVAVAVAGLGSLLAAGCGGDDADDSSAIEVSASEIDGGLVELRDVTCERAGDQLLASGVVRNQGDNPHYVSISVRFDDADGVRVELASDSVSTLEPGESAHWDATVYPGDRASTVVTCDVSAEAS
jgi:hypothetical protein